MVASPKQTGNKPVAIGSNAGQTSQGAKSVAIGFASGQINQAANSVAIGASSAAATNSTAIGFQAVTTAENTIQLGADGVSVTGSTAITNVKTSGTLTAGAVTYPNTLGTNGQLLTSSGSGTLTWTTATTTLVPFTGANKAVNLGAYDLTVNGITIGTGTVSGTVFPIFNTAVGNSALSINTTGYNNTALGYQSLKVNTSGFANSSSGVYSLYKNSTGSFNSAFGISSLYNNTTGSNNTAFGRIALLKNETGSYNTALGNNADVEFNNLENATAIGSSAIVSASNTIQLGNTDIANVKTSGTITAGNVTYPKTHNSTANQVLSIDASGIASFNSLGAAGATLTNGKILVGNASNVGTEVTVSGDITMTNAGVVSITAGAVSTADLANSAVTYAKIQNITAGKLIGSTIASAAAPVSYTHLTLPTNREV